MKIAILSSNLSNEAGGYAESSFLLRDRLNKIKNNDVYLFGFWKSKFLKLNYQLTDRINIFHPGFINKFPFSFRYFKKLFLIKPHIIDLQGIWSSTSILSLLYYSLSKTPYIVTPRGMLEKWALQQSYLKKKIFLFFNRKISFKKCSLFKGHIRFRSINFYKTRL